MTICDMCKKDYSKDRFTDTGYFTVQYESFHVCAECAQKIKDVIESDVYKHIKEE